MTKRIADPDKHYNSQADLALIIHRVSQSDAGRYDCSGATVELSVTSGTGPNSITTPKTTTTSTSATTATSTTTSTAKRRGKKAKSTTTTTSRAKRTATKTTEASTTTEDLWKVLTTVTVSCLVAVVLVLLSWICFYKRKGYAVKHNQEHVYDSIDDTMPTAQPGWTLSETSLSAWTSRSSLMASWSSSLELTR
ncbi:cell wall integrity and stress response component 3-like isoform X2 [Pygocentrus nattereri]|uniref:cell wall integrity and stress response component 3-like isoform X2 n=1 Tax=Pygocentrus nattereri TaxID=42514 RepID=UPI001891ED26|nr:cell wall integrity and stress response component 3-like isoform X2 [Pygocentrus nattereri]